MMNNSMRNNIKKTAANLKMKIIPDITANASLDGSSFDTSLTHEKLVWMEKIRSTWVACKFSLVQCASKINTRNNNNNKILIQMNLLFYVSPDKKGVILTSLLHEFYSQSDNPFLDALKFYARLHLGSTVKTNSIEYMGMANFMLIHNYSNSIYY